MTTKQRANQLECLFDEAAIHLSALREAISRCQKTPAQRLIEEADKGGDDINVDGMCDADCKRCPLVLPGDNRPAPHCFDRTEVYNRAYLWICGYRTAKKNADR